MGRACASAPTVQLRSHPASLPSRPLTRPPQVRKLGPNANPAVLKRLPLASGAMWAFYGSYIAYVMLSTTAPGLPVWQTSPETLAAVFHESLNYFYINIGLSEVGGWVGGRVWALDG